MTEKMSTFVVLIAWLASIGGCATSVSGTKESILPQNLKSMDEIYREHTQRKSQHLQAPPLDAPQSATPQTAAPPVRDMDPHPSVTRHVAWDSYTRSATREIDNLFPTLPNPILVMYVYPHLSTTENTPIPGYSTAFPMYERPEFALPGEQQYRHPELDVTQSPLVSAPDTAQPAIVRNAAPSAVLMTTSAPRTPVTTGSGDAP